MKRLLSYLLAAMVLLSCGKLPKPVVGHPLPFAFDGTLLVIDSLMQHDADSALQMLLSFRAERGTSSDINANYQALLTSEALFKTYNPQYYRDDLQSAMRFFDSLSVQYPYNDDIVMLSARSHYMNGVGYYESDNVVEACKEYLKTLEIMEDHFEEKDLVGYKAKFMSLTYGRLGDLFSDQFMATQAIDCCKKALFYRRIEPTSKYGISASLTMIGKQYHELDSKDSASYYYKQALEALPNHDNSRYRDIVSSLQLLDYQMSKDPEIVLDSLRSIIEQANNYNERLTRYLTIGCIFYNEKQYDSAVVYLEKVYYDNDVFLSKMQAAEYLCEIYRNHGDTIKSDQFSQFLADNALKEYNKKAKTSYVNELYQQHLSNISNKQFIKEKRTARRRTALIILPISALFVAIVFLIMRKWGKRHIARHKAALESTQDSLSEIKMKIVVRQFADEPVCKNILGIVKEQQFKSKIDYVNYKGFALGNEQIMGLRAAANLHYDNFTIRLKDKFPELTNDDIDYCCLYLLGLKDADVSALMQKEYSTIRHRRSKIKTILNTDKNLTEALYNLTRLSNTIH